MDDFARTNMGHRFINGTLPELVRQLIRLNDNLEKYLKLIEREEQRDKERTKMGEGGNVA